MLQKTTLAPVAVKQATELIDLSVAMKPIAASVGLPLAADTFPSSSSVDQRRRSQGCQTS
jgi:hypothetical protein